MAKRKGNHIYVTTPFHFLAITYLHLQYSLAATIKSERPDLLADVTVGASPIPATPPLVFETDTSSNREEKEYLGRPMVPRPMPTSPTSNFDPTHW